MDAVVPRQRMGRLVEHTQMMVQARGPWSVFGRIAIADRVGLTVPSSTSSNQMTQLHFDMGWDGLRHKA
jgi:hypothetical protein